MLQAKEQDTRAIIDTLNRCVALLPGDKLQSVRSIGVSGQMHGVLFWRAESGESCRPKFPVACFFTVCGKLGDNGAKLKKGYDTFIHSFVRCI